MLEVKFWPNKDTSNGALGGGYIVTDIFKFSYKVRQGQYGPWVILPNVKKADGSGYTNLVDFVNKDAKDKIEAAVKAAMSSYVAPPTTQQSAPVPAQSSSPAPQASEPTPLRRNVPSSASNPVQMKLPWE